MNKTLRKHGKKKKPDKKKKPGKTVNKGKGKSIKKEYRPKCKKKKMKGGALLFPSVNAVTNGISSTFTGFYNSVQGNTPVHSSNTFDHPFHKKI